MREFRSGQKSRGRLRSLPLPGFRKWYSQYSKKHVGVWGNPTSTKCKENTKPDLRIVEM